MGIIADAFSYAFRDYQIDGDPNTPQNEVAKSEVRPIGDVTEIYIAAAVASGTTARPLEAVRAASTSNVSIATGLVNGASAGGVTLVTGNRFALGGQSSPAENGIYIVVASGAAPRSTDLNSSGQFPGATVYVKEGTNAGKRYAFVPAVIPVVVGTTAITVVQVGQDPIPGVTTQTIGANTTPATGTTVASNTTWAFGAPVAYDGFISRLRLYSTAAGDIRIRKFTKSGDTFSIVSGDISVSVASGLNTITRASGALPLIEVTAGQYLGFYVRKGACLTFLVESGVGHYNASGDLYSFDDAVIVTTQTLQLDFLLEQTTTQVQSEKLADLAAVINSGPQTIGVGKGLAFDTSSGNIGATTFVLRNPIIADGHISKIEIGSKGAGRFYFKRFTKSGDNFNQVAADLPIDVFAAGNITLQDNQLPYMEVLKGEYIGFYRGTGQIAFLNGAANQESYGDPYYSPATNSNASSFTDAATSQFSLQIRFTVELGDVARIDRRIDVLATQAISSVAEVSYYEDTIISASMIPSGLDTIVSVVLNRDGIEQTLADTETFTAATSGYVRYDTYYLNGQDLSFGKVQGTERTTDYTSFLPVLTDPKFIPLFSVRVTNTGVSALPIWRLNYGVDRATANQMDLDRQYSRRCLPKLRSRIAKGSSIRIVGFGDSITSIRSDTETAGYITSPNGAFRDRATSSGTPDEYLATRYGSDVLSAITLYAATTLGRTADGAGTVHTKIGWNWELVAALENLSYVLGTDLFYDNYGRGGWSSADAVVSGAAQPWLTNAAALGAHVAVVALGMNERGASTTEANLKVIADTFKAAGTEVIFMGVPRPATGSVADWQYTNRAIKRAALLTNSAHVPTIPISDDRFIHAMGIASQDIAAANGANHPGLLEFNFYGRELTRHILG